MSVSYIPEKTKILLWGKAAGRCQYRGCNVALYRDKLTKAEFNKAYIAHIIADSSKGPRGDLVRSEQLKKSLSNLMLLCDEHHRLIDKIKVEEHPESLLLEMKAEHEKRIEIITAISVEMKSHIVIYKANVGIHTPPLSYESINHYILPKYYPANNYAIDLSLNNSPQRDRDNSFWMTELENLELQFNEQLRPRLRKGEFKHLSIFAFAPIPLLIKLGTLLNDIQNINIHHPIRNPKTWNLSENKTPINYIVKYPNNKQNIVALNISLSATVNNSRVIKILGNDCSIYTLTIRDPFNDYLKDKKHLEDFSITIRKLFNEIKSKYSSSHHLHIFPAMPIATALELGRVWMPKADMPLYIYDENTARNGFIRVLEIKN